MPHQEALRWFGTTEGMVSKKIVSIGETWTTPGHYKEVDMESTMLKIAVWCAMALAIVRAECPNACSSHGRCGAYDACICYRNWGANDCSERICQFGRAHVDTPLGDLDASGGPPTGGAESTSTYDAAFVKANLVAVGSDMYPHGTYEKYPRMENSDNVLTPQSAHDYRECSNKGLCDRSSGTCECFPGYEGSACQRASCPTSSNGVCSGHGVCKTIQELSSDDHGNLYRLWDEDVTMGCDCDAGYTGPDCSQRVCKYGADPLYYDDFQNVRFANFTLNIYMESNTDIAYGNYSIIFTDRFGEDWQTDPIDIDAPCSVMQERLESLPNNVIPTGSVLCSKAQTPLHRVGGDNDFGQTNNNLQNSGAGANGNTEMDGYVVAENGQVYDEDMLIVASYILAFPGNPGEIKPLRINKYLDGARPTLFTTETGGSTLDWHIFPNGYIGEDTDYVNDECEGVLVQIDSSGTKQSYLTTENTEQDKLLKACLGDSNGIASDNVDVQDWDWGSWTNPHLIKLVDATQDEYVEYLRADGSSYKMLVHGSGDDGKDYWVDNADADYPISTLCNNRATYLDHKNNIDLAMHTDSNAQFVNGADATNGYLGSWGFCKALNPPGFFAVLYYDDCSDSTAHVLGGITKKTNNAGSPDTCHASHPWRLITNSGYHYGNGNDGSRTKFHVFTTKGTLQQVSQYVGVHTVRDTMTSTQRLASYHSNVVYLGNTTTAGYINYGGNGEVDCETMKDTGSYMGPGAGKNGLLDCLRKDDKVIFLNLGDRVTDGCYGSNVHDGSSSVANIAGISYANSDSLSCGYAPTNASFLSNPPAINMYTVKKISEEPPSVDTAVMMQKSADNGLDRKSVSKGNLYEIHSLYRRRMILDHGMNANYQRVAAAGEVDLFKSQASSDNDAAMKDSQAYVYKFYPPTLATTGTTGRNYVGECSNRGICDGDTGICKCFPGYSGDNCGTVSSLVK